MAPRGGGDAAQSVAEMMAATTAEIVRELIAAHKKRKDVNLNKLKTKISKSFLDHFFKLFANWGELNRGFFNRSYINNSIASEFKIFSSVC